MIVIDYKNRKPVYEQITEQFQELILRGILLPDTPLPSVRSLAMELSINPNTVQRAYAEMERCGLVYSVTGRGSFVNAESGWKDDRQNELLQELRLCLQTLYRLKVPESEIQRLIQIEYRDTIGGESI